MAITEFRGNPLFDLTRGHYAATTAGVATGTTKKKDCREFPTQYGANQLYTKCTIFKDNVDEKIKKCSKACQASHRNECMFLRDKIIDDMCDCLDAKEE